MTTEKHLSPLGNEGATQALSRKRATGRGLIALRQSRSRFAATALLGLLMLASACTPEAETAPTGGGEGPIKVTNRIDVPEVVRNNLGITFAKVERRKIAQTLRVPGRFEYTPAATREQRAALAGRVTLHVKHLDRVETGTLLYGVDAPAWRAMQQEIAEADARYWTATMQYQVRQAARSEATLDAELTASRAEAIDAVNRASLEHTAELENTTAIWAQRVEDLEKLLANGTGKAADLVEARAHLSEAKSKSLEESAARAELALRKKDIEIEAARIRNTLSRLGSEEMAAKSEMNAALAAYQLKLRTAVSLTGLSLRELQKIEGEVERWRNISKIEVFAAGPGVVSEVAASEGGWVEQGGLVLSLVDPAQVRVRARALQADLSRITNGQSARILPPAGGALAFETPLDGKIAVGLTGDADERVIELFVTPEKTLGWARPGVAVEVEITLNSTEEAVLAVPISSVVRDELQRIVFRRDPNNPDKVIRINGEFGISDGRWIEIKRDVVEGDEVVLGGVYELKLTGSGKPTGAGHFHADGTFHQGTEH